MGEILRSTFSKPKKSQNALFWRENMFKALGDFSESDFCSLYNQSHDAPTLPHTTTKLLFQWCQPSSLYYTCTSSSLTDIKRLWGSYTYEKWKMKKKKKKTFSNSIFIHFGTFKKKKNFSKADFCMAWHLLIWLHKGVSFWCPLPYWCVPQIHYKICSVPWERLQNIMIP